jgi:hypothetical protein
MRCLEVCSETSAWAGLMTTLPNKVDPLDRPHDSDRVAIERMRLAE